MNRNDKIVFLMYNHNSCACNGDCLILLTKTGNIHKERILPQTTIDTSEKCKEDGIKTQSKLMVAAKWWLFRNYRNKLFNGKLSLRFGAAFFIFIFVVLNFLTALLTCFRHSNL